MVASVQCAGVRAHVGALLGTPAAAALCLRLWGRECTCNGACEAVSTIPEGNGITNRRGQFVGGPNRLSGGVAATSVVATMRVSGGGADTVTALHEIRRQIRRGAAV